MSVSDLDQARERAGWPDGQREPDEGGASSAAERSEAAGELGETDEMELFPQGSVQGDDKVTLKNIVPGNTPRKNEAKMGATAIPLVGGLVRYGQKLEFLVTVQAGFVKEVPDLAPEDAAGNQKILGVKDVQAFRPVFVQSAAQMYTHEQVIDILHKAGVKPAKVAEVLGIEEAA